MPVQDAGAEAAVLEYEKTRERRFVVALPVTAAGAEPTATDLERAKALRESLLVFIERNTKAKIVLRPFIAEDGRTAFPGEHIDRELARILAQARAEGREEVRSEAQAQIASERGAV